ncbi:hypothetical protein ASE55_15550 [Chryseobacterium sp. Leaf201]|nr:hypothetical protein ASE55_15550 [Chryseobacterium sp. Leaf201]
MAHNRGAGALGRFFLIGRPGLCLDIDVFGYCDKFQYPVFLNLRKIKVHGKGRNKKCLQKQYSLFINFR